MVNTTITIPLDPETAQAYAAAAPEKKRIIQFLLGVWLRDLATKPSRSLEEILDDMSRKAEERGLTQEILDSLLKEE